MATVLEIEVKLTFVSATEGSEERTESFDPADSSLQSAIDERADELLDELNEDLDEDAEEFEFVGHSIESYDTDWADPDVFDGLDEYGAYAELVEQHGEAYHLYYDNTGNESESSFEDAFAGSWSSFQEYAEQLIDDCYEIPDHLASYIDYEKWARDLEYDYFTCEGSDGDTYIFRNC